MPHRGGHHWYPECGSTDWPVGRNTRTTGRSTPLVNTQTHRCTNITHWCEQLFSPRGNGIKRSSAESADVRGEQNNHNNRIRALLLPSAQTATSLFPPRMADCELCHVQLSGPQFNQTLWCHPAARCLRPRINCSRSAPHQTEILFSQWSALRLHLTMFWRQVNYWALQKQILNSQQLYENRLSDDELYTIDTYTVQIYV